MWCGDVLISVCVCCLAMQVKSSGKDTAQEKPGKVFHYIIQRCIIYSNCVVCLCRRKFI